LVDVKFVVSIDTVFNCPAFNRTLSCWIPHSARPWQFTRARS
jgi:hypothetical protein